MQSSFITSLSFLMIANSTIKSSHLLKNRYDLNLALLPHLSSSTLKFQNVWFKHINLIHFTPVTFNSCKFGSSSIYIESKDTLIIQNCVNLSGYIKATDRDILVQSTNLSQKFKTFDIINANGNFESSTFSSSSNMPVILTSKSNITIKNCKFSKCCRSGIRASQDTKLNISDCIFNKMKSREGAAIDFSGDELKITDSIFKECKTSKVGGAIKFTGKNLILIKSIFAQNESPKGNSIYLLQKSKASYISCSIPNSKNEIYVSIDDNRQIKKEIKFSGTFTLPDTKPTAAPPTASPPQATPNERTDPPSASSQPSTPTAKSKAVKKNDKFLFIVIGICVVVVVIAIVAVTAVLLQKKKNQIYPSDYDGDDEEPKKTTVTIANINDVGP